MASKRAPQRRTIQKAPIKPKPPCSYAPRTSPRLSNNTAITRVGDSPKQETQQGEVNKKRSIDTNAVDSLPSKRPKIEQFEADAKLSLKSSGIEHWLDCYSWPKEEIKMDAHDRLRQTMRAVRSLSRKRSVGGTQNSDVTSQASSTSDEYQRKQYSGRLAEKGYFMTPDGEKPPTAASLEAALALLKHKVELPLQSRFDDKLFDAGCRNLRLQNETRVVRDFGELIFPSPQHLFNLGWTTNGDLAELYNETWNQARKITDKQPRPDASVGYQRSAFTREQISGLSEYLGEQGTEISHFAATPSLIFEFIASEVKKSEGALFPADNANAHSMFIAVRNVVDLYKLAGCDTQELSGQILAFSLSHNDDEVRIWAYYPFIQDGNASYHRVRIKRFFLSEDREDRWTAYRFVAGVYDVWAKTQLKRLQAVIEELIKKDLQADEKLRSSLGVQETGCSQQTAASTISDELDLQTLEMEASLETAKTSLATPTSSQSKIQRPR